MAGCREGVEGDDAHEWVGLPAMLGAEIEPEREKANGKRAGEGHRVLERWKESRQQTPEYGREEFVAYFAFSLVCGADCPESETDQLYRNDRKSKSSKLVYQLSHG